MKKSNYLIRSGLVIVLFSFFSSKAYNQCLVDYTTQNYFCDLDSLLLTAVPLEGVGPFSFIWETGETTQTIMIPLALGDYMLTMTDANGCVSIINCHIKPFPQVLYYPYNQNACEGDTVTLFLDWFRDSIPGATYLWSTGETTPSIQLTDDLVWSVTVTDPSNGCEFVIPPGLFDFHPTPNPEIVGSNILCNGETITLSVAGGPFGNVFWHLPNGETYWAETLEVTEPGMYIVWGSSPEAGYCWHQDTIDIIEGVIDPPLLTGPPELCSGQSGTISLTNYALFEEYVWSTGETTSSITVNAPGTYTITVTDNEGCTASESLTIGSGGEPELSTDPTAATCGESNGSIDLTTTPPQSYDFLWSNGATTPDLNDIPPGNYSVTVTDLNGCSSTATEIVPDEPIIITINETITPNTSCTNFNGAIDIFILPVGEPYSFQWSNGATTEDIENLAPGTYSVTVSTGINCNATVSYIVEDNSGAAEINPVVLPTSCGESNGSIDLQLTGGQGPFSYLWSNGNTTEGLTDMPAGTYSVTVTGSDGCVSTASIVLPNEDIIINVTGIVFPNTSCDQGNGEIDVTLSPVEIYEFAWSNGATTEDIINIDAGTYTLTVTLGISCSQTATFTVINENIPFDITSITSPNTSCVSPNGAIDLSINPAGTYSFLWSSGQATEDIQDLDEGIYTVTVTDDNDCAISTSYNLENSTPVISISGITIANTSCQVPNGMIDISITPPGTYSFIWSTGSINEDLQNIPGGTYGVTVTSVDGCTADSLFVVDDQNTSFSLSAIPSENTSCTIPNGALDLSVSPAGSYTYLWSNGMTTEDLQSINAGIFSVTVTDNNSCSSSATFIVGNTTSPPLVSVAITNEICNAGNAAIDLTVMPAGATFLWSSGETSEDLINIQAGTYIVSVTGLNGCMTLDTFNISNTSNNFSLSAVPADNNSCINPNGSINLVVVPAGSYTFLWSTGSTTEDLQDLDGGTYQVTVTDSSNCTSTASFTIQSNTVDPVISEIIIPASCGQMNGSIDLSVIPTAGNLYLWSDGSTSQDMFNIAAGIYSVTVTGGNGCTAMASFMVPDNSSNFTIGGNATPNYSCISPDGSITLNVNPPGSYTYTWSNGATSSDLQGLPSGIYQVTVTDNFNCSSTIVFTIDDNFVLPELSFAVTPANCLQSNGAIDLTVTLTTGNSFLWSNGATNEDILNLLPGTYAVTVTGSNGCSASGSSDVPNQNSNFTISATVIDDQSCTDASGSIDLTITPGGTYTFQWSNGVTSEDIINISSGIYEVTVTDFFNCSSSEIFTIEDVTDPPILSEIITSATCGESNAGINLTIIPATGNSFIWSTGDISEDLQNIPAGPYSVTVTNINGCTVKGDYSIPDSEPLEITIDADLSSFVVDGTVTCSLELNLPLTALDTIIWSPEAIMSCHDPLCVEQIFILQELTQISVMAMDTNGCMGTANLLLDIDKEFRVYIPNVFTPNGNGPNDMFTVYTNDEVEEVVVLEIFDRWGNNVFANENFPPNDPSYGWDGVFKGQLMNPAVFAYRAVVRFSNGEQAFFKGDVTLVR